MAYRREENPGTWEKIQLWWKERKRIKAEKKLAKAADILKAEKKLAELKKAEDEAWERGFEMRMERRRKYPELYAPPPPRPTVPQASDDDDFLISAAIGAVTDSALLGGLLGGNMAGGLLGDVLDGDLFD